MPSLEKKFREFGWNIFIRDRLISQKDGNRVCFRIVKADELYSQK